MKILTPLLVVASFVAAKRPAWPGTVALQQKNGSVVLLDASTGKTDKAKSWSSRAHDATHAEGRRTLFLRREGRVTAIYCRRDGKATPVVVAARHCREFAAHRAHTAIAYTVDSKAERRTKFQPRDIRVRDIVTGRDVLIASGVFFSGFRWSLDGKTLAISAGQAIWFVRSDGTLVRKVAVRDIDKRLYAHGAYNLVWRDDNGAVACRITFLGGRAVLSGEEPKPIYGDREVFLVAPTGAAKAFTVGPKIVPYPIGWTVPR